MKLEVSFDGLQQRMHQMGATRREWVPNEVLREIWGYREELEKGVSSSLTDIDVSNGGLLSKNGQQVVVYIKDHTFNTDVLRDSKDGRRVHLCDCKTLQKMKREGRYERYVSTIRTGEFLIDVADPKPRETESHLHVCINCIKKLNIEHEGRELHRVTSEFDFLDFFERFSTFFAIPARYTDFAAPSSGYSNDWYRRSYEIRERCGWNCSDCRVFLGDRQHRKYLHVHHHDGVKRNEAARNLVALCVLCHSRQPSHQHMKVPEEVRELIQGLRREQN